MRSVRNLVWLALVTIALATMDEARAAQMNCSECDPTCNQTLQCDECGTCQRCTDYCAYFSLSGSCTEFDNPLRCGGTETEIYCQCY